MYEKNILDLKMQEMNHPKTTKKGKIPYKLNKNVARKLI